MNKKLSILILGLTVCLISCQTDLLESPVSNLSSEVQTKSIDGGISNDTISHLYKFIYKGEYYETFYSTCKDSIVFVENQEIMSLLSQIEKLPELATFLYNDGVIEYFDTNEELHNNLSRIVSLNTTKQNIFETTITRNNPPSPTLLRDVELYLYDNDNFRGTKRYVGHYNIKPVRDVSPWGCPSLKQYDMNDKTTSLVAYVYDGYHTVLFELFEDTNYSNHCFSFIVNNTTDQTITGGEKSLKAQYGQFIAPDLKKIHVVGTKRSSWNDRISSIRISGY